MNVGKTKYMVMSREENAAQTYSIKFDNCFFKRVEEFRFLGTTLTNENCIQEKIKSNLKSANDCYHSAEKLLSSSLPSNILRFMM